MDINTITKSINVIHVLFDIRPLLNNIDFNITVHDQSKAHHNVSSK